MNTELDKFKGIFVAAYSCFDKNDKVNEEAIINQIQFYKKAKVNGIYVCGSTGEGLLMSKEERKETLEIIMKENKGELTIINHVGCNNTKDSIELAIHSQELGCDAISSIPCVYYVLSEKAILNNYENIIKATSLPFILYNIPQLTKYCVTENLYTTLLKNKQVIGIKNSAEDVKSSLDYKIWAKDRKTIVFHGYDEQLLAGLSCGCEAGIGGTYGVMPELYILLYNAFKNNEMKKALEIQLALDKLIKRLTSFSSFYSAAKSVLSYRLNSDLGIARLPFLSLSKEEKKLTKELAMDIEKTIKSFS